MLIVIVANNKKAYSKIVTSEIWNQSVAEYTGKDPDDLGDFPVNSFDCMVQDPSVNNSWKNLAGVLYDKIIIRNHLANLWEAS